MTRRPHADLPATATARRTSSTQRLSPDNRKVASVIAIAASTSLSTSDRLALVMVGIVVAAAATLYMAPSIVAARRRVPNLAPIVFFNLFLGWSLIGWVLAWVLALATPPHRATRSIAVAVPPGSPSPGWYQDPRRPERLRWWTGTRWSDATADPSLPQM